MPVVGGIELSPEAAAALSARSTAPRERPSTFDFLKSGGIAAYGGLRYGLPYAVEKVAGTATAADDQYYQAWINEFNQRANAAAPGGPAGVSDLFAGRAGLSDVILENVAYSAPYLATSIAGGVATGGAGILPALAGAGVASAPLFTGSNVNRAVEDGTLTQGEAARSLAVAPLQGASDALIGRFIPGIGGRLGFGAVGRGGFVTRTGKSIGKAAATEALAETGQQVAERYAAGLPLTTPEALGEFVEAFGTAAIVGGGLGSLGGLRGDPNQIATDDIGTQVDQMLALAPPERAGELPSPRTTELDLEAAGIPEAPPLQLPAPEGGTTVYGLDQGPGVVGNEQQAQRAAELAAMPSGDLRTAANQLVEQALRTQDRVDRDLATAMLEELQRRQDQKGTTEAEPVEAAQDFQTKLEDYKKGIKQGSFVKKLQAETEEDLLAQVYDQIFVAQDTRKSTVALAQRVGLIDEDLKPTDLARQVEARQGKQDGSSLVDRPARDPDFEAEIRPLINKFGYKDRTGVSQEQYDLMGYVLDSRTPEELDTRIYEQLAAEPEASANATRLEAMARSRGLLDRGLNLTEKGREIAVNAGISPEERQEAARAQGFTDPADVSAFERGILAKPGQPSGKFTQSELKAYVAGVEYAKTLTPDVVAPDVSTNTQTADFLSRYSPRGKDNEDQAEISRLNTTIDSLNNVDESDRTFLKLMVRTGQDADTIQNAINQVASGQPLFTQPERGPVEFRGEVVTPGARNRAQIAQRRQQEAKDRRFLQSRRGRQTSKVRQLLGEAVEEAYQSGDMTGRDRIKAIHMLSAGNYVEVKDMLSRDSRLEDEMRTTRREFLRGVAATAAVAAGVVPKPASAVVNKTPASPRLRGHLENGNIVEALKHMRSNSSNKGYQRLAALMLKAGGWDNVSLITGRDRGDLLGATEVMRDGSSLVALYGEGGLTEEAFLHEALHAFVQQRWAKLSAYVPGNKRILQDDIDRSDELVRNWQGIWQDIRRMLERTNPELVNSEAWAGHLKASPDEMFSWVLTNGDAQAYLKSITPEGKRVADVKNSMWQQIKQFFLELIGGKYEPPYVRTALDVIMDAGNGLLVAGRDVKPGDFSAKLAEELYSRSDNLSSLEDRPPSTVDEMNTATMEAAAAAKERLAKLPLPDALTAGPVRRALLGFLSVLHLQEHYGATLPALKAYYRAHEHRRATEARFAKMFESIYQRYDKAAVADKVAAGRIQSLMQFTINNIDPRKDWDAHTHLHELPNAQDLRKQVKRANDLFAQVQKDGNAQIYSDLIALNETMQLSSAVVAMRNLVLADKELTNRIGAAFAIDPMTEFRERAERHTNAEDARDYWSDALDAQLAETRKFIRKLRGGLAAGTDAEGDSALSKRLAPVENQMRQIEGMKFNMGRAPYFHLGRQGKHFVAFTAGLTDAKVADPAKIDEIERRLDAAGFNNATISTDNQNPQVYITLENRQQRQQLFDLVKQMERDGLTDPDKQPRAGLRGLDNEAGTFRDTPQHLQQFLDLVGKSDFFDDSGLPDDQVAQLNSFKSHFEAQARELWLDLLPDASLSKVLAPRAGVQGSDTDMIRSYASRLEIGVRAIAGMSSMRELGGSVSDMRQAVKEAQTRTDGSVDLITDLTGEVLKREANRARVEDAISPLDKWRAASHAYFLGGSISYGLINLTQVGVLLWPELAKKQGGFVKAGRAIARVTPVAFNVMRAVMSEVSKQGWKHLGDVTITADVLKKAGLDQKTADFVMQMTASGVIDIGAAARELGRITQGKTGSLSDTTLRLAGGVGLYTETFTRLVAALSAREMDGGGNSAKTRDYARDVVGQSMLNYATWNTARQLGKAGVAGEFTPVITQFYQYNAQVLEKLYREIYRSVSGPGTTPEQRAEARRFLGVHFAAVTMVAGSLGLPFMTVISRAAEGLVELFDDEDEPYDITAAYRRLLAGIFGKDVGEVIARGVPRAFGVDISRRAGEQDILPFTRVFADRRPLEDAGAAWLTDNATGAAGGMIGSIWKGSGKLADGDVPGALAEAAPLAFRGIAKNWVMGRDGFTDSRGNVLPLDPNGSAYIAQLFGFSPAEKAEYSEERGDQIERRGVLTRRANDLRDKIADAIISGDDDAAQDAISSARKFDANNPAFQVLPDIGTAIQRRLKANALSRATGLPYGVSVNDVEARSLTGYGNYN